MMKPTFMQRKFLVRAALVLLLIAGSFMVLLSSSRTTGGRKICTETMEDCSKKIKKTNSSGEMIWETLSRQFISSVEISD